MYSSSNNSVIIHNSRNTTLQLNKFTNNSNNIVSHTRVIVDSLISYTDLSDDSSRIKPTSRPNTKPCANFSNPLCTITVYGRDSFPSDATTVNRYLFDPKMHSSSLNTIYIPTPVNEALIHITRNSTSKFSLGETYEKIYLQK